MTIWLKQRLAIWMGVSLLGGALLGNVGALRAQNSNDAKRKISRVKLTREEAARNFVLLLRDFDAFVFRPNQSNSSAAVLSSISLKSERELQEGLVPLLQKMAVQWRQNHYFITTQKVQMETANTATVTVANEQSLRSLVLIREQGNWGVDVFETQAMWKKLQGDARKRALTVVSNDTQHLRDNQRRASCQSNLKRIFTALEQYAADHNNELPPAEKWADVCAPYLGNQEPLRCPSTSKTQLWGYAFNARYSAKDYNWRSRSTKSVLLYETTILKRNAYGTGENLAFRHQDGANYAFADGHVKWFPKTEIPSFKLKP